MTARLHADTREGLDVAARAGLVAYGVVHLLVAWVAVELALGDQHRDYSGQGALRQLADQPVGRGLVWAIAVGMLGFCVQRVVEGFLDEDGRWRAWGKAVVYAAVGVSASMIAAGSGGGGSGKERSLSARVMDHPGGVVLVVLVGLGFLAVGAHHAYRGLTQDFRDELSAHGRQGESGTVYLAFGQVGYTAKGVVIALIGVLVGWAGVSHDPQKSGGLDEALRTVRDQPFGPALLIAVAAGIGCYGLFCFAQARHLSR
jgi:amino acid transporter